MNGPARIDRSGEEAQRPDSVTSFKGDLIMRSFSLDPRDAQSHTLDSFPY
jgi:hypothetical protein